MTDSLLNSLLSFQSFKFNFNNIILKWSTDHSRGRQKTALMSKSMNKYQNQQIQYRPIYLLINNNKCILIRYTIIHNQASNTN